MTQEQPQTMIIDGKEYPVDSLTDQQKRLVNHCIDLENKINGTQFQLEQLTISKDGFVALLKKSLES